VDVNSVRNQIKTIGFKVLQVASHCQEPLVLLLGYLVLLLTQRCASVFSTACGSSGVKYEGCPERNAPYFVLSKYLLLRRENYAL
jgi:hypothetical protein